MPLELYHMHLSQSERILWLLEELGLSYTLHLFHRDPLTAMAPDALKALHPAGTAPFFRDTGISPAICLSESTAIAAYLLAVYSPQSRQSSNNTDTDTGTDIDTDMTRLDRKPGDPEYAAFLQWFHYANGSLQAAMFRHMQFLQQQSNTTTNTPANRWNARLHAQLLTIDTHLSHNKWLAGEGFSAADCMSAFSLTTMRGFAPLDLGAYPHILRWLGDVSDRPAYRRALEKGEGGMEPMVEARTRVFGQFPGMRHLEGIVQASRQVDG